MNYDNERPIPVVFADGSVEYLPPETRVEWPAADPSSISKLSEHMGRYRPGSTIPNDKFLLTDGRVGIVEGLREEVARLRGENAKLVAATEGHNKPCYYRRQRVRPGKRRGSTRSTCFGSET